MTPDTFQTTLIVLIVVAIVAPPVVVVLLWAVAIVAYTLVGVWNRLANR